MGYRLEVVAYIDGVYRVLGHIGYRRVLQRGTSESQQEALLPFGSSFLTNCKKEEEECAAAAAALLFLLLFLLFFQIECTPCENERPVHSLLLRRSIFRFPPLELLDNNNPVRSFFTFFFV
jgi:hypothetical protein